MSTTQVYPRHFVQYISLADTLPTDIDFDNPADDDTLTITDLDYALLGFGVQSFSESPDAQTTEKAYINMTTSSTSVDSYNFKFTGTSDLVKTQEAIMSMFAVSYHNKTGGAAERNVLVVDNYATVERGVEPKTVSLARLMRMSVAVSSVTKEGVTPVSFDFELSAVKDTVFGYFDAATKTFTVDSTVNIQEAN